MALNFPNSPSENDIHTHGTATYRYRNNKWTILRGQYEYITEAYSAVPGDVIFANTSSSAFTITLPATPPDYSQVKITDSEGTFYFNNVTVDRNGSTIEGLTSNFVLEKTGKETTFVYYNSTWNIFTSDMLPYTDPEHSLLVIPSSGIEGSNVNIIISTYDSAAYTYSHSVEAGTATRSADTIAWQLPLLPFEANSTYYAISVTTSSLGGTTTTGGSVLVIPAVFQGDDAIIVTDFNNKKYSENWSI